MDNNQQATISFNDIKPQLVNALNSRLQLNRLHISEKVNIIDGFVNQPLSMELSGSFVIGGPTIPMVMLVGEESGRIYYFALKAILPNLSV